MKWYEKQKKLYQDMNEKSQDTEDIETAEYEEELGSTEIESNAYEESTVETVVEDEERNEETGMDNEENYMDTSFALTEETNISKDACLTGDLKMEGNLKLSGTIIGNISCSGDVRIDGKVEGDISCANAYFDHAEITGNIICQSYIEILEGTSIKGNIQSSELQSNGYIEGNVDVRGDIRLSHNAVIEGDVAAQYLESEKGSSLKGQCVISAQD